MVVVMLTVQIVHKNLRVLHHHLSGEVQSVPLIVFPCIGEDKLA